MIEHSGGIMKSQNEQLLQALKIRNPIYIQQSSILNKRLQNERTATQHFWIPWNVSTRMQAEAEGELQWWEKHNCYGQIIKNLGTFTLSVVALGVKAKQQWSSQMAKDFGRVG